MNQTTNEANIKDLKDVSSDTASALVVPPQMGSMVAREEIDMQIATAHKYPRNIGAFRNLAMSIATLNEGVAAECLFALPRDGKVIEGPSIRLAEIIVSSWRNARVGSRTIHESQDSIVAQGIFHDLETNVAISSEVERRIVDKDGKRYKTDMILTTKNAAQSIALRNAITRGVPRAIWWDVYQAARRVAAGDQKSLATKRADAIAAFAIFGVDLSQILEMLGRESEHDMTREDLVQLFGVHSAIKDGESTPEDAFPPKKDLRRKTVDKGGEAGAGQDAAKVDAEKKPAEEKAPVVDVAQETVKVASAEAKPKPPTQGVAPAGIPPPEDQVPAPKVALATPDRSPDPDPAPARPARRSRGNME
jgi:hypothetical protein